MDNMFAYTAPGGTYPEYISVNIDDEQRVTVIVRSAAKPDGACGDTSQITLSHEQLSALANRLFSFACCNKA